MPIYDLIDTLHSAVLRRVATASDENVLYYTDYVLRNVKEGNNEPLHEAARVYSVNIDELTEVIRGIFIPGNLALSPNMRSVTYEKAKSILIDCDDFAFYKESKQLLDIYKKMRGEVLPGSSFFDEEENIKN